MDAGTLGVATTDLKTVICINAPYFMYGTSYWAEEATRVCRGSRYHCAQLIEWNRKRKRCGLESVGLKSDSRHMIHRFARLNDHG